MVDSDAVAAVTGCLSDLRLLDHPYYRCWQDGRLQAEDLSSYAEQYRHFERTLPQVLSSVAAALAEGRPRQLVESNLADELSRPRAHVEMFDQFATSVGAEGDAPATEATRALVDLYVEAVDEGPVPALAVIAAYEIQAGAIAATKAASLSEQYRVSEAGTEFWRVHAEMEEAHASWTTDALDHLGASSATVQQWAGRSARAWWAFLDERDTNRTTQLAHR